jgi:hypothetical protein
MDTESDVTTRRSWRIVMLARYPLSRRAMTSVAVMTSDRGWKVSVYVPTGLSP